MTGTERSASILVCTLGASWAVIPEVAGFLTPCPWDLYRHHPEADRLAALRERFGLEAPTEVWVITTGGDRAANSLRLLRVWWEQCGRPFALRIWQAEGTDHLNRQEECEAVRELIQRVVLHAHDRARGGAVMLSLAGGRKTMSADLQSAGSVLGARAMLHVVGPDGAHPLTGGEASTLLLSPLPSEIAATLTPLVVGRGRRDEALDVPLDGQVLSPDSFPLPWAGEGEVVRWAPPPAPGLFEEISRRQQAAQRLLGNFVARVAADDRRENWRSLYRMPPAVIDTLRRTRLDAQHLSWLTALPKADLHRHLGGCLDLPAQRRVAEAVWSAIGASERQEALSATANLLEHQGDWPWSWPEDLRGPDRAVRTCALLVSVPIKRLQRNLYGVTEPRVALKRSARGFPAYERPGELTGSALLSHPAALRPYAAELVMQAREEGLSYLELRGSPQKYRLDDPSGFVLELQAALRSAGARTASGDTGAGPRCGFLWILDRRTPGSANDAIASALKAHALCPGFMLGVDLAGDEGSSPPEAWADAFDPVFRECLSVTIHAGEDEPAANIWEAAYRLHADRIGHGLSLADHAPLMSRFRDRGVCLELCPTSNVEVVGFRHPDIEATSSHPEYPLRSFIDHGVAVTLCTDNPGISRTSLPREYVSASAMVRGGITLWEALALMRQGMRSSFLPAADRRLLMEEGEARLREVMEGAWPGLSGQNGVARSS
jgi:adenosine deaminase